MVKWITLALVAALLFSAGLYAGHRVPFSAVLAQGAASRGVTTQAVPSKIVARQDTVEDSDTHFPSQSGDVPATFISHAESVADAEVRTAEFEDLRTTDGHNADDSDIAATDIAVSDVAVSDAERAAIRKLILQHFPNTKSDLAEIWVETYAGMDPDEINFVLEQKKQTSSELGATRETYSASLTSSLSSTAIIPSQTTEPERGLDRDIAIVTTNLRSAYSIGYRRIVVMPEAVDSSASPTEVEPRDNSSTRFRSFESGPLIQSPIATHLALSSDTSVMFCLEGNRVTRRGDFQILKDRRLGIVTSRGEFAALESTALPAEAKDIHILQNGTVSFTNAAGEAVEAGRITVCCIKKLADLQTNDGVLFQASDEGQLDVLEHPDSVLRFNCLEQSNVNRLDENPLLEHLKSLRNSSL